MAQNHRLAGVATASVLALALLAGCAAGPEEGVLRLGYFPNLTHAQALYGIASGDFQDALGNTTLRVQEFNAGPTAFESLLAGRVDVIFVGPSPTITAIDRRGLDVIAILSGAASGGASFVARAGIDGPEDLHGTTLATPQLGNTQDVALKHYLKDNGLQREDQGGDVEVINAGNADILTLFLNGRIDGAWVPEPWVTRLVLEGGGRVFVNEADLWPDGRFVTTHLVTTRAFLEARPDDLRNLLAAHDAITKRLQEPGPEDLEMINDGMEMATGKRLSESTLQAAVHNIEYTTAPLNQTFRKQFDMAHDLGFADRAPDIDRVYALEFLPASAPGAT
jgi:NitT/TauT family transport system substrate-binding protein